ncbi:MAG: hypothetical protein M1836_005258 [Candelina mexicana]|nr:MAG: hypothetical protein M1836_005258 [Candelina mexicana]
MPNINTPFGHDSSSEGETHKKAISNAGVKRKTSTRASRAGTRSVNTLSAAQLERKRANDREAQRAIRQRTKDHIDKLERRIADLSLNYDASEKLSNALQRNEMLESEVVKLRSRLGSAASALGYSGDGNVLHAVWNNGTDETTFQTGTSMDTKPVHNESIPPHPLVDSLKPRAGSLPLSTASGPTSVPTNVSTSFQPAVVPSSATSQVSFNDPWQYHGPGSTIARSSISDASSVASGDYPAELSSWPHDDFANSTALTDGYAEAHDPSIPPSLNFNFLLDANHQPLTFFGNQNQDETKQNDQMALDNPFISANALTNEGIPIIPRHGPPEDVTNGINMNPLFNSNPMPFINQPSIYAFEIPIRNVAPTCQVDNILLSFMHRQRNEYVGGATEQQLIGPAYPSVSSLINPDKRAHPVSKWQISPNPSTYDALPDWLTPRASQLVTFHPIWMDQIPWPKLRDRVITEQATYNTIEFQTNFTASTTINWPYRPMDALVFQNDEVLMNPVFERHIQCLDNWSIGAPFATRYPELAGCCKFKL